MQHCEKNDTNAGTKMHNCLVKEKKLCLGSQTPSKQWLKFYELLKTQVVEIICKS